MLVTRLLLIALGLVAIRAVARSLLAAPHKPSVGPQNSDVRTPRRMVQDPVCQLYLPADRARVLVVGGQEMHFCSTRCQELFRATAQASPS